MMASVTNKTPTTPRQAARRRAAVDRRLDTELFKALADPTRTRLPTCLVKCGRPCSVTELADPPNGFIKHVIGLRQFLLRGLDKVRTEWLWACTAFNMRKLILEIRKLRAVGAAPLV